MHYPDLWGKGLLFLSLLWFLWFINMCVRVIFAPILPLIEDEFAVTHARASGIFMFQAVGYGLSMFFSGFFAGRLGYKRTIVVSLCLSGFFFLAVPFVKTFSLLYLLSLILGISIGMYMPSAIPLITEYFAEKDWGKSIAIHDSGAAVSICSIPLIAILLLQFMEWRGIFSVFGVAFLVSAAVFQFSCKEVKMIHSSKRAFGDLAKNPSLWLMAILFTFVSGANLGIYSIVPLYLTKELSLDIDYANLILFFSRLGGIMVAIVAGFMVDRVDLRKVLFFLVLLSGALTIMMALASTRSVGVVLFFQAVFVSGFYPVGLVSIARMFGREMRSMATGLILTAAIVFGVGLIPYLLGVSGDLAGFRFGILILGILVSLTSFISLALRTLK